MNYSKIKARIYAFIRDLYTIWLLGIGGGQFIYFRDRMASECAEKSKLLKLRYAGQKLSIRTFSTDMMLVDSILIGNFGNRMWMGEYWQVERYLQTINSDEPVVIDAGANVGLFTRVVLKRKPNAKFFSIEPERNNYNILKMNTEQYSNVVCMQKGLWSKECSLEVIERDTGNWGFMVKETEKVGEDIIDAISIDYLLNHYNIENIDLLKMDVEGSEYEIFSSENLEWLNKCHAIVIETHNNIVKGADEKVNSVLLSHGYKKSVWGENQFFLKT